MKGYPPTFKPSDPTGHQGLHDVARAADAREAKLFESGTARLDARRGHAAAAGSAGIVHAYAAGRGAHGTPTVRGRRLITPPPPIRLLPA